MNIHVMGQQALRQPMLSREEEGDLAKRARAGDARAMNRLVTAHSRIALRLAVQYRHYGLPLEDLFQEGNVGLMLAAEKFDVERGFRFATYATWWVRAAIQDYVIHNASMVRAARSAEQKNLFFRGRRARAELAAAMPGASDWEITEALADRFGCTVEEVELLMAAAGGDYVLDTPLRQGESDGDTFLDRLVDGQPLADELLGTAQEMAFGRTHLSDAIAALSEREQDILTRRRLTEDPETLEGIGRELGVSKERVRQIEAKAFQRVAAKVRRAVPA